MTTQYTDELRCYTWTIFQLSSIQQGIQAGHAAIELFPKYIGGPGLKVQQMLNDWARHNKTMVCLNGGDVASLREFIEFLNSPENPYPWASFTESEDFLAGITTSVAIILPMRFYQCAAMMRSARPGGPYNYDAATGIHRFFIDDENGMRVEEFTSWEGELMQRSNASPLAR